MLFYIYTVFTTAIIYESGLLLLFFIIFFNNIHISYFAFGTSRAHRFNKEHGTLFTPVTSRLPHQEHIGSIKNMEHFLHSV